VALCSTRSAGDSTRNRSSPGIGREAASSFADEGLRRAVRGRIAVVDVDDGRPDRVSQRRQLVHPLPVVALVVGAVVRGEPAVEHQCRFDLRQALERDQYVDVGEQPSPGRGKPGHQVRRALEQDDVDADLGQRLANVGYLPAHGVRLRFGERLRGHEVGTRGRRHAIQQAALGDLVRQPRQQIRSARLEYQRLPLLQVAQGDRLGIAERARDRGSGPVAHDFVANASKSVAASSRSP